jgi:hypothetical protein
VTLSGLDDPDSIQQETKNGIRRFPSGLEPKNTVTKEISVVFQIRDSYLNWMIWFKQALISLDKELISSGNMIILQVLDSEDNIIIEVIYDGIFIKSLDDIEFSKQDNGIVSKDFTVTFIFSNFNINFNTSKFQDFRSDINSKYSY